MKTVYILWIRQLIRYARSKSRIIGSLAQPALFLFSLAYGFGPTFQRAGQGNYLEFLAPWIIGMGIIFTSIFSGMEIIWDRQFGFLKETLVAPVSRFSIMLGRTLGGATIATFQWFLVLVMAIVGWLRLHGWMVFPELIAVMFLIALLFAAMGTMIASRLADMQGFQLIMNFLVMPLFFLSGAIFPLDNLPSAIRLVSDLDPLSYGVDALRAILIGTSYFWLGFDLSVLTAIAAVFLVLGAYSFSKIRI